MVRACNRIIEYSFYGIFFLVPLAFTSKTSELFELNKMWLVWALTIIIAASWLVKMILQKKIIFQKTPLDIPIGLFLFSQVISTIFSLDFHTSLWGYYSRFNGGLLSITSYILLYYAFLSNFLVSGEKAGGERGGPRETGPAVKMVKRLLFLSLISGLIVALWGLPSHFGYDPTCLLFRGTFDVSCWTADFMPKIRIFSTLGQPDWLAAYLAILIPIAMVFGFQKTQNPAQLGQNTQGIRNSDNQRVRQSESLTYRVLRVFWDKQFFYILLASLFYVDLLYTRARSGFLGILLSLIFFFALYLWMERKKLKSSIINHQSLIIIGIFLLITFIIGTPINQLNKFTLAGIGSYFQKPAATASNAADAETLKKTEAQRNKAPVQSFDSEGGGTESANIRMNVWKGALEIWKNNPLFGTGVETFAFAYYKYKPISQNLTSEWNFLYNKAHNEYLNYLATTGMLGLGSYAVMIGTFIFVTIKQIKNHPFDKLRTKIKNIDQNSKLLTLDSGFDLCTLIFALLAGYISILVTNFFGFSVVITNIYLFLIPAFVFVLSNMIKNEPKDQRPKTKDQSLDASVWQLTSIFFIVATGLFMLFSLFRFWRADIAFALGYNLDRAGEYQQAYPNLHKAVKFRGDEPVFKDELSLNDAFIAAGLASQKIKIASSLMQEAINISNEVISQHSNNAVFWKTRTRLFYTLSQVDPRYLTRALDAIGKASLLAPNDANIWYNLGVLYGQNNNLEKGISALEKTIMLKPDYRDAHYALGLFYHQKTIDKNGNAIDSALREKAIAQMQYILDRLNPRDSGALESIKAWKQ